MFKKLDLIEAIVFVVFGIVIDVVGIIQKSDLATMLIGALFILAGILHFIINVKNK